MPGQKENNVDLSNRGAARMDDIIMYTAFMKTKKGSRSFTSTADTEEIVKTKEDTMAPMSQEEMDRKLGEEKGKAWRNAMKDDGTTPMLERRPCPMTGSMKDPLVLYIVPRALLRTVDSQGWLRKTQHEHDGEADDKQPVDPNNPAAAVAQ